MKIFKSPYDFYELEEVERISLVGRPFREERRHGLYIPIFLSDKNENYGVAQGVLYVSDILILKSGEDKDEKWFKVGAFSPDDLDIDLEFVGKETCIRQEVIDFLLKYSTSTTSYKEILAMVITEFKMGTLY